MLRKYLTPAILLAATVMPGISTADDYVIDTKDAHAFIHFRIQHLGYSWLYGRFDDFEGSFSYDPDNPDAGRVNVTIDVASINSNHAERDKHLRGEDFFHVSKFPRAKFVSTAFDDHGDGTATLKGDLTIKGVTRPVSIAVKHIGHGKDPWGGYRRGFYGTTTVTLKDFNIDYDLGPAAKTAELILSVEGIRQ